MTAFSSAAPQQWKYGTIGITADAVMSGDAPVKNWDGPRRFRERQAQVPSRHGDRLSGEEVWLLALYHGVRRPYVSQGIGPYQGVTHHKVEYETAAAWGFFRTAIQVLTDTVLTDTALVDVESIASLVLSVPGVLDCHAVRARGPAGMVRVDLHIHVDPATRVDEAHDVVDSMARVVRSQVPDIIEVLVHVGAAGVRRHESMQAVAPRDPAIGDLGAADLIPRLHRRLALRRVGLAALPHTWCLLGPSWNPC